jgi:hypothetical protein
MSATATLRALIERRFPDALPPARRAAGPVATGVAALDRILPQGGFPRGRVAVWRPRGGAVAVLRAACAAALERGERAAWVDGARTAGADWARGPLPLLLRPCGRALALRFAELLARSGGLSLVVLAGAEPSGAELVRLSRAAHEGGGAVVALTTSTLTAGVRLASRFLPDDYRYDPSPFAEPAAVREAAVAVEAWASGWSRRAVLRLPIASHDLRLSLEPGLADRRGLAR